MPFDPFFSSANKKHYVPVEGVDELYKVASTWNYIQRKQFFNKYPMTKVEMIVASKLRHEIQQRRYARIHNRITAQQANAQKELRQGKRIYIPFIVGNYNTCDSGNQGTQKKATRR